MPFIFGSRFSQDDTSPKTTMVTDPKTAQSPTDGLPPAYVDDAPPEHSAPGYSTGPSSSSSSQRYSFIPAPNIHPCNHLLISEKDATIQGQYVLDVGLPRPALPGSMSPIFRQLGDANMRLEVRDGGIKPNIWLAALKEKAPPQTCARIFVKIRDGQTDVILHAPHPTLPRPRIALSIEKRDGRSTITLPRSFEGYLLLKKRHGNVVLSPGLQTQAHLLVSADGTKAYSVGQRDISQEVADEVKFDGRDGELAISFDDEAYYGSGASK